MTLLTIYTPTGDEKLTVRLNSGAEGTFTLGTEDYVTLPFTLAEPVIFNIGDWADLSELDESLGGHFRHRYVVTEQPEPSWSNTTGGYEYKLRLDAYYMAWRHKIFKYLPQNGTAEASWSLTATLDKHLNVFLKNLTELGYTYGIKADGTGGEDYTYSIDGTVEEEARLIQYENTSLVDALTQMAQTWDCDWWVDENKIKFGRCEDGDTVDVEIGKQASSMSRSESSGTYCNRLYAFGSDRNVPLTYRRSLLFEVTSVDGQKIQDEARKLQSSYFGDDYQVDTTTTQTFSVSYSEVKTFGMGRGVTGTTVKSETALTFEPGLSLYTSGGLTVSFSLQSRTQNRDSSVTGALTFSCSAKLSYTGDSGDEQVIFDINGDDGVDITNGGVVSVTIPIPDGDFYLSEEKELTLTVSVAVANNTSSYYSEWIRMNGSVAVQSESLYPCCQLIMTFQSGKLKGQTVTGYLNKEETEEDRYNITLESGTALPSIGDTFTIDNILSSQVPQTWWTLDGDEVLVNGVVSNNLTLPKETLYIDAYRYDGDGKRVYIGEDGYDKGEEMPVEEAVEQVIVNDEIYPRTNLTVTSVTTYEKPVEDDDGNETGEYQTFYRVKLAFTDYDGNAADAFTFSKDYRIDGTDLGVVFKSGLMNGMDFIVNFNPEGLAEDKDDAQMFEIIASDDYGRTLPDNLIYPQEGDSLVLYGWDCTSLKATEGLVANAEQELYDYAVEYIQKLMYDDGTYTVKLYPAWVNADPVDRTFRAGQRINLVNRAFFPDGRLSRVIGFQLKIDIPLDNPTYTIGESTQYSRLGELEGKLDNITYRGASYCSAGTAGDGTSVYLIKTNDSTAASDSNAYSALRAQSVFLRKDRTDTMPYPLTLKDTLAVAGNVDLGKKLTVADLATFSKVYAQMMGNGDFLDGFFGYGWQLFQDTEGDWNLTLDRLTVRKAMTVYELIISKIRSVGGQLIVSAANGEVADVMMTEDGTQYVLAFKDECEFTEGDLMRCQKFTGTSIKYYWVEVSKVESGAAYVNVSEFGGVEPEVGDEVVLMGNTTNTKRQNFISISATEDGKPRIEVHNRVSTKNFSTDADGEYPTLRAMFGNLDGITDSYFPSDNQPQGDGLYADNAYLRGRFILKSTGNDIETQLAITEQGMQVSVTEIAMETATGAVTEAVAQLGNAVSKTSYLANGYFGDGLEHWTCDSWGSQVPYLSEGLPIILSKSDSGWNFLMEGTKKANSHFAYLETDGTRTVLYMRGDCEVRQTNADFETLPTVFDKDADGLPIARLMRLTFYAKAINSISAGATISAGITGQTDTESWDYMEASNREDQYATLTSDGTITEDSYTRVTGTLRWNGTGDFSLTVNSNAQNEYDDAEIRGFYIYGLTLEDVTDDTAEALSAVYSQLTVQAGKITEIAGEYTTLSGDLSTVQQKLKELQEALNKANDDLTTDISQAIVEYIGATTIEEALKSLGVAYTDDLSGYITSSGLEDKLKDYATTTVVNDMNDTLDAINKAVEKLSKLLDDDGQFRFSELITEKDFNALFTAYVDSGYWEDSGVVTESNFAAVFSQATQDDTKVRAIMGTYVSKITNADGTVYTDADGHVYLESGVIIKADQILLEGYMSINKHVKIDTDGKLWADEAEFSGIVTATSGGNIGGFVITSNSNMAATNNDGDTMTLSPTSISFTNKAASATFGGNATISKVGYEEFYPMYIKVARESGGSYNGYTTGNKVGNIGIYLDVTGANAVNNAGYQYTGNHALYVPNGDICGFRLRTRFIDTDGETLSNMDSIILVLASITLYLPLSGIEVGQVYFITKYCVDSTVKVTTEQGNRYVILYEGDSAAKNFVLGNSMAMVIWSGEYWVVRQMSNYTSGYVNQ
ncbi:MAG: hypothetical protein LUI09_03310 [Prevotellaceae bacterium]|nr:hypothetical protein [Prevotellaceae bacterium]